MKTRLLACIAPALLLIWPVAGSAQDDEAKKAAEKLAFEIKQLQGNWSVVAIEHKGKKVPPDVFKDFQLVISRNTITTKKGSTIVTVVSYQININKKPKWLDTKVLMGTQKGQAKKNIYEFEGDNLRICGPDTGKERPKDIGTKADSDNIVIVLKKTS